jgi:hypothetical protein
VRLALLAVLILAACGNGGGSHAKAYDPSRNAFADLREAEGRAKAERKHVLVEAGGNWCSWCTRMHEFYDSHAALTALRDKNYVTVRVNVEVGAPIPPALAGYPAPSGFPHIYILDGNGTLVKSKDTGELESGETYSLSKFEDFLSEFAPKL